MSVQLKNKRTSNLLITIQQAVKSIETIIMIILNTMVSLPFLFILFIELIRTFLSKKIVQYNHNKNILIKKEYFKYFKAKFCSQNIKLNLKRKKERNPPICMLFNWSRNILLYMYIKETGKHIIFEIHNDS